MRCQKNVVVANVQNIETNQHQQNLKTRAVVGTAQPLGNVQLLDLKQKIMYITSLKTSS